MYCRSRSPNLAFSYPPQSPYASCLACSSILPYARLIIRRPSALAIAHLQFPPSLDTASPVNSMGSGPVPVALLVSSLSLSEAVGVAVGRVTTCVVLFPTTSTTVATLGPEVTTLAITVWPSTNVVVPSSSVSLLGSTIPSPDAEGGVMVRTCVPSVTGTAGSCSSLSVGAEIGSVFVVPSTTTRGGTRWAKLQRLWTWCRRR